jgi:hypothetical protein
MNITKIKDKIMITILVYSEKGNELGYWNGINNEHPNDSISKANVYNWETEEQAKAEIKDAEKFAKKHGWTVSFKIENLETE